MDLGAFSVSLNVKNVEASKAFYEKLGFSVFGGDASQGWLILKNGTCILGLFQGMIPQNTLTFNPGWDQDAKELPSFTDIREIQKELKRKGVKFVIEADESTSGPTSFTVEDPDGNPILFDQFV